MEVVQDSCLFNNIEHKDSSFIDSIHECCDMCGVVVENKTGCHYTCHCGYQTGCGD